MSTWHQKQRPARLWHATEWTVVVDPPHECMAVMRFDTREAAETYLANCEKHGERYAYIVNPGVQS